ncbi:PAS domain-containing protein [Undibacterium arcticum]|uniref:PAS domain-containing protein n=1 Tax=Undibacterium arcticum TaxID=1762892 RepID=UPI0036161671
MQNRRITDSEAQRRANPFQEMSAVRIRAPFDLGREGILMLDADSGVIVEANPAMSELTGYTNAELLGRQLWELDMSRESESNPVTLQALRAANGVLCKQLLQLGKRGRRCEIEVSYTFALLHDRPVIRCKIVEIAHREHAERTRHDSENLYRSLINISPQGVWLSNPDGILQLINQYWTEYSGLILQSDKDEAWINQVHPADRERVWADWQNNVAAGTTLEKELRLRRATDDEYRWHLMRTAPVREVRGRAGQWLVVVIDIHERKCAEETKALLGNIIESSDDAVISKSLAGVITSWNAGAERLFGYTAKEAIGKPIAMLLPEERQKEELALFQRIRRGERINHIETVGVTKGRTLLNMSVAISPLRNDHGEVIGASIVARDITERRRSADALRISEQRFAAMFRQATAGVAQTDLNEKFILVNQRFSDMVGRTADELLTLRMRDITHPEDLQHNNGLFRLLINEGEDFVTEKRYMRPDGTSVWVINTVSLVRDTDNRPVYTAVIVFDVTSRNWRNRSVPNCWRESRPYARKPTQLIVPRTTS